MSRKTSHDETSTLVKLPSSLLLLLFLQQNYFLSNTNIQQIFFRMLLNQMIDQNVVEQK